VEVLISYQQQVDGIVKIVEKVGMIKGGNI
jgi:hypothetical protein